MNGLHRRALALSRAVLTRSVGACATDPTAATDQTAAERDAPTSGSHIGRRYSNGPDASGVTIYSGNTVPGSPGGNGMSGTAH